MTVHISLGSQNIVNLYPGLAEDAEKEGAELLEPTKDEVTYSDGMTETVNSTSSSSSLNLVTVMAGWPYG